MVALLDGYINFLDAEGSLHASTRGFDLFGPRWILVADGLESNEEFLGQKFEPRSDEDREV